MNNTSEILSQTKNLTKGFESYIIISIEYLTETAN